MQPFFTFMRELKLTSAIPPSVNHYLAYRAVVRDGRATAMSYCTQEASKYKKEFAQYVGQEVIRQGYNLKPDPMRHFYVDCDFYFPRLNMDANNYYKCLLDAITDTKLIWLDDNVVCERTNSIRYDTTNPRVEIYIHPVDYIGVFDSASHLEEFESRCIGCVRHARNCSLLDGAIHGRVNELVHDGICDGFKKKKKE